MSEAPEPQPADRDIMRREYDFADAVRGVTAQRLSVSRGGLTLGAGPNGSTKTCPMGDARRRAKG